MYSVVLALSSPTITNFSVPTKIVSDSPFNIVDPSSNSTGAFTYTSSNTSVATISGRTITIVGAGTSTITATQTAAGNYTSGTITATFQVNQASPTITNFSVPTKTFGDSPFNIVDPSSNSTGAFTYISSNTSVATISGRTISIVGAGTSTITATQSSTTNYSSGTVTATFQVNQASPTITNFSVPTKVLGDSPFNIVDPSSNSTGAFTYTSSNTSVATISGRTITIVGAGTSTITATQSSAGNYTSGTITATFQVNQTSPTITNFSVPTKTFGDTSFNIVDPSSNSTGSFIYISSNSSVATISGRTVTIVGNGTSTIMASQDASGNYTSGAITTTFQVNKAIPTITNFSIPTKTFGDPSFTPLDI
jgi:uncharacterized protein YjdB